MNLRLPVSNASIIAGSFGLGLFLAGRYVLGTAAVVVGALAQFSLGASINNASTGQKLKNSQTHLEEPPPIDNWYYAHDSGAVGPLLESQIFELMQKDEISNDTLVYNTAISDKWISLDDTHFVHRNHHRGY